MIIVVFFIALLPKQATYSRIQDVFVEIIGEVLSEDIQKVPTLFDSVFRGHGFSATAI